MGGYLTDMTEDRLRGAPSYRRDRTPDWGSGEYETKVQDFYGLTNGAWPMT
jgi:hypothetical protein